MVKRVLVLLVLGVAPVLAAEAPDRAIDPRADAALRRMSDYLAGLRNFRFESEAVDELVSREGLKVQRVSSSRVSVARPNRLRVDRIGPLADVEFRYDGKSYNVYGKRTGYYASAPAPATIDAAIDAARDRYGIEAPAADLLLTDIYGALMDGVVEGRYIGLEPVGGTPCHHLAFRGANVDWQIWIEDGPHPLPRRYVIVSKDQPGAPEFTASISHWEPHAPVLPSEFEFHPPPGSKHIDLLPVGRQQGKR